MLFNEPDQKYMYIPFLCAYVNLQWSSLHASLLSCCQGNKDCHSCAGGTWSSVHLQWQCTCSKQNFEEKICLSFRLALSQVKQCISRQGFVNKVQYTSTEHLYVASFLQFKIIAYSLLWFNVDSPSLVFHTPQWHHHSSLVSTVGVAVFIAMLSRVRPSQKR